MIFNFLILSALAFANIKAVATTNDVGWLLQRIGGNEVEVKVLAKPNENYHFIEARPDFILALSRASVFCQIGAELEIGWAPKLLEKAANPKILAGSNGSCNLASKIKLLDKPTAPIDRSMGDVHGSGNPHFWLSPIEMVAAGEEVYETLSRINPEKTAFFEKNLQELKTELTALQKELTEKLKPLSNKKIYEYHKEFAYFANAYGLNIAGSIEEIPGVSPSASRLGKVGLEAKRVSSPIALASISSNKSILEKFAEISGSKFVALPTSVSSLEKGAYSTWQRSLVDQILKLL
jgi:zinc/manganese transport system substrate-binding protein